MKSTSPGAKPAPTGRFFSVLRHGLQRRKTAAVLGLVALPLAITTSFFAIGSASPPAVVPVTLASEPLYAALNVDKPAMALALSVEFPTVGAQYTTGGDEDSSYANTKEYLGYYDAESCYAYNNNPTETPAAGLTSQDYKRFYRTGAASSRQCSNAFSGNFLNWASGSAIDMLRLALSGGDRYIDTPTLTVLQRALVPCMWNNSNFPGKKLVKNGGGTNAYWGAVPNALITQAAGSDIWVANNQNRMYFGTAKNGSCSSTTGHVLGGAPPVTTNAMGTVVNVTTPLPADAVSCTSAEGQNCSFSGIKEVWYGALKDGTNKWAVVPASNGLICSNGVLGDPWSGTSKRCYVAPYTGSWAPPVQPTTALNTDGFFYARAEVCSKSAGALNDVRDYGLCRQYPNGNFKPTGVIQKYSDQLRLAAFGYVMDQTPSYSAGRYGGVLRAPMKYVGAKTFDIAGRDNTPSGGNPNAEWSSLTGVFNLNPDGDTTQNPGTSGVINYLNKFGRTGPTPATYKTYDPVGELHYEALRYLQGLQPSPDAIQGLSNTTDAAVKKMWDGFPLFQTWQDPYGNGRSATADYSCLKSNIVVVGDINTHDGGRLPTPDAANNIPDIAYWRGIAQKFEAKASASYVDGQGVSRITANPNTSNGSLPTGSQTSQIIGSSYWSHIHDIRGASWTAEPTKQRKGLRVKTFLFDVNEYGAQTKPGNSRRTANQFFMASKYGGFESDPSNPGSKPYNTFGNPFQNQDGTPNNNVWQKPADPGEANTYYVYDNAKDSPAREVLTAFDEIFSRASTAARNISGGAASFSNVANSGSNIYSAKFDTSAWSGDVVAEPVSLDLAGNVQIGSPIWSASDRLDVMASPAANRKIFMGVPGSSSSPAATSFVWSDIGASMQAHLSKTDPAASADTLGQARLDFLRGDRSREGSPFRVRSSLVGDIVNSNVTFSGPPALSYAGNGYAAFRTAYKTRTPAVFAGANDGMLHAFDATNGDELFAYIPSWLAPRLSAIAETSFVNSHQVYVDAPSAVGEAQVANTGAATDWKTVLVSGTGGGGPGVFALDVSDPAAFDTSKALWEFTRADDADMGNVVGIPRILKFKTGSNAYRWFAVVASGVNNHLPDATGLFSSTGAPALFLLALDKPAGSAWALGTNYYKVSFPIDATLNATLPSGMANFSALYGPQGEVTEVYAGDLRGNLWKLRFADVVPADWNMDKLSYFNKGSAGSPLTYPMYIAKDATGVRQPITAAPAIFQGPEANGLETFYVIFGTGKFLESGDNTSIAPNSVYTLLDDGSSTADSSPAGAAAISGRGRLKAGTVNTTTKAISVDSFIWGRPASDTAEKRSGWYFDMPISGEKLVSSIQDLGDSTAAFNTIIPGSAGTAGSCSSNPGSGNQYVVNVLKGEGSKYIPSTVGLLGPALYLTTKETETATDSTGRRVRTSTKKSVTIGQQGISADGSGNAKGEIKQFTGRLSWRQINNYQEMKNK